MLLDPFKPPPLFSPSLSLTLFPSFPLSLPPWQLPEHETQGPREMGWAGAGVEFRSMWRTKVSGGLVPEEKAAPYKEQQFWKLTDASIVMFSKMYVRVAV